MACALGKRRSILLSYEGSAGSILNSSPEHLLSSFNYWRESSIPRKNDSISLRGLLTSLDCRIVAYNLPPLRISHMSAGFD